MGFLAGAATKLNTYRSNTGNLFSYNNSFPHFNYGATNLFDIYKSSFTKTPDDFWGIDFASSFNKRQENRGLGTSIAKNAQKYLGYSEKDGSYLKFGEKGAWCVAFSTYVTKEALRENGKSAPNWLNTHSVAQLKKNAEDNGCFLQTRKSSDKASLIAANVKVGDTAVFKNGRSHVGVVTKIYSDGSFDTTEGNTSKGTVANRHYSANEKTLTGFVQVV